MVAGRGPVASVNSSRSLFERIAGCDNTSRTATDRSTLTPCVLECYACPGRGLSSAELAAGLQLSEVTVPGRAADALSLRSAARWHLTRPGFSRPTALTDRVGIDHRQAHTALAQLCILGPEVVILPAIDLDLRLRTWPPHRVVADRTVHDVIDEQVQPPALGPQFVILRPVVRVAGTEELDLGRTSGSPNGRVQHLAVCHVRVQHLDAPALRPQLVVARLHLGVPFAEELNFAGGTLPPHRRVGHLAVDHGISQQIQTPTFGPEVIVLVLEGVIGDTERGDLLNGIGPPDRAVLDMAVLDRGLQEVHTIAGWPELGRALLQLCQRGAVALHLIRIGGGVPPDGGYAELGGVCP